MSEPQSQSASMEESLKKLLVQSTSITNTCDGTGPAATLKPEDKQFLEQALESTINTKPEHGLMHMMKILEKLCLDIPRREPTADELEVLEGLQEAAEDFDCADAFIGMGGIKLCDRLLDIRHPQVRVASLDIIANVALNNSTFQNHPDGIPLLKKLLCVEVKGAENSGNAKVMSAVSSIISSNALAIKFLLDETDIGLDFFFVMYDQISAQPSPSVAVALRTARVIEHIFSDFPETSKIDPVPITINFCRKLLQTWWDKNTDFLKMNLELLYSILIGKCPPIRKQLRAELGSEMTEMANRMRDILPRGEDQDGKEDEDDTLANFQHALKDEDFGVVDTQKPTLAICP